VTTREWFRLARPLLDETWTFRRTLAYHNPVSWILNGLFAETSAQGRSRFYLWIVTLPLYLPHEALSLSWSVRFGGGSHLLDSKEPEASAAVRTARDLATTNVASQLGAVVPSPGTSENASMQEARAYGLLLDGDVRSATEVLQRVLLYRPELDWEYDRAHRAELVLNQLTSGKAIQAREQLEYWRQQSASRLGLDVMPVT
jgi:hypothetical protein